MEGFKIGAFKNIHTVSFTIDTRGKDTWRYADAGAKVIVSSSDSEVAVLRKDSSMHKDLDYLLSLVSDVNIDAAILEGFHEQIIMRKDVFKIVVAKTIDEAKGLLDEVSEPIIALMGPFVNSKSPRKIRNIPVLQLEEEGEKLVQLVKPLL